MKPIFKQEKKFLEKKLGIDLPDNCWRSGSKIYLNHFDKKPFLTFKSIPLTNEINVKKYEKPISKNYSILEEYEIVKETLNKKVKESIKKTKEVLIKHKHEKKFVSISGGKDSDVMKDIVDIAIRELITEGYEKKHLSYNLIAFNTSNETAQTYKYLKQVHKMTKENIISPEVGWYQWIADKNYFLPSRFARTCCGKYKEGQLNKIMNKKENTVTFLGMRSAESVKRSMYKFDLNEVMKQHGKMNVPDNWKRYLPIVEFTDAEVWLYILSKNLKYNEMYNLGFNRVGCAICPNQNDYIDLLLREFYPEHCNRWSEILIKNYYTYGVERRLKWSLDEWVDGAKWKDAKSKESELISKKMTPKRVMELAQIKNISEDLAKKFFNKKCSCGKKMNPTEISMFLKLTGRYENQKDEQVEYLCKNCLCERLGFTKKQYTEMSINFINEGCDLF